MIIIFDIGFILFLLFVFFSLIGGTSYAIVDYINQNLGTVIFICILAVVITLIAAWVIFKDIKVTLSSIIYSTQFCFFTVYGLYLLGMMRQSHPIKCILLFFCFFIYVVGNLTLLLYPFAEYGEDSIGSKKPNSALMFFLGLGIVGWIVNFVILF